MLKNKPFACAETRAMWLRRFTARGIAGWRIDLLPLTADTGDHLQQYSLMDMSLDPWPYAGVVFDRLCCAVIHSVNCTPSCTLNLHSFLHTKLDKYGAV